MTLMGKQNMQNGRIFKNLLFLKCMVMMSTKPSTQTAKFIISGSEVQALMWGPIWLYNENLLFLHILLLFFHSSGIKPECIVIMFMKPSTKLIHDTGPVGHGFRSLGGTNVPK